MIAPKRCRVGQEVVVEGYADDYGRQIAAIEFTLDDGATWASFDTSSTDPDLMVSWRYSFTPQQCGTYVLKARSVREDGARSPLAASVQIEVFE